MAKPRISARANNQVDTDVMFRAAIIAGILLGLLLAMSYIFIPNLLGFSKFAKAAQIGIELLIIWLVITSTIRSIYTMRRGILVWKLLVGGLLAALLGPVIRWLALRVFAYFNSEVAVESFNWNGLFFFAGLGLLATLIALIRVRVRNRAMGNMLEFGLIITVALLFFYFMK